VKQQTRRSSVGGELASRMRHPHMHAERTTAGTGAVLPVQDATNS